MIANLSACVFIAPIVSHDSSFTRLVSKRLFGTGGALSGSQLIDCSFHSEFEMSQTLLKKGVNHEARQQRGTVCLSTADPQCD